VQRSVGSHGYLLLCDLGILAVGGAKFRPGRDEPPSRPGLAQFTRHQVRFFAPAAASTTPNAATPRTTGTIRWS
jgi:hypothetical protein